ncbi:MAG TPA: iron-sulfur cluster biosynthesis family protein [Nitrospiraceae bacterium]|jgi:Fe-S cluster assembly iron-binding protein IscA|nr:iron-sulfur cluster biosynthesis family protein [Nitrospiraceae bacterium]
MSDESVEGPALLHLTWKAVEHLRKLVQDHPEEPVVRVQVRDLDERRLSFSIMLDSTAHPEDEVQHIEDLAVAVDRTSVHRMDGMTLDYEAGKGFVFLHPPSNDMNLIMPHNN